MSHFILSQEDGSFALGRTGYYVLIAVLLLALLLSAVIVDKKQKHTRLSVKGSLSAALPLPWALSFPLSKYTCPTAALQPRFPCSVSVSSAIFMASKQDCFLPLLTVSYNFFKTALIYLAPCKSAATTFLPLPHLASQAFFTRKTNSSLVIF